MRCDHSKEDWILFFVDFVLCVAEMSQDINFRT